MQICLMTVVLIVGEGGSGAERQSAKIWEEMPGEWETEEPGHLLCDLNSNFNLRERILGYFLPNRDSESLEAHVKH